MSYMKMPPEFDRKKVKLPVGTRIKFVKELSSGPDEYSPGNLYAEEGGTGEVLHHDCSEGHFVKWDKWKAGFGAEYGTEFLKDYAYYEV